MVSVNDGAFKIVERMIEKKDEIGCEIHKQSNGATIIDAGVNVPGSNEAGIMVSEICLGGLGTVTMGEIDIGGHVLPSVEVKTDNVPIACLGSQYAGWTIKVDKYFAMASGPARALAKTEKLYKELEYSDNSNIGVIVLETREFPPENVTEYIAEKCGIRPSDLYIVVAPTACLVGSIQISARVVEVGAHKFHELKFSPFKLKSGTGTAPVAPIAKNDMKAMGVTNDCILFAGDTYYEVEPDDDDDLAELIPKVPSSSSEQYGTPFYKLFKSYNFDFYKVDPLLFSPARVTVKDIKTGKEYSAGKLDFPILRQSIGLK